MKAIALIALSLALEAGFLWQISVIAHPQRQGVTVMAIAHEPAADAAAAPTDGEPSTAPYYLAQAPRS